MEEKQIKTSKVKLIFLLLITISFILMGILFISKPEEFTSTFFRSSSFILISGYISVIFFGLVSIIILVKFFDYRFGLIINQDGIIDNTNVGSVGLVKWNDITEIKSIRVASSDFLLVYITNPQDYLQKANKLKRILLNKNLNSFGTPITLTAVGLQCSFNELKKIVAENLPDHIAFDSSN